MKRIVVILGLSVIAFGFISPSAAERELRNFGSLGLGLSLPDDVDFSDAYRMGFVGTLGYGTRISHSNDFFAYGMVGYNKFRSKDRESYGDTYLINLNADARYYFGPVGKYESIYVGLGPGIYWDEESNAYFGANIAVGGDFPVGDDWSITADVDQHLVDAKDTSAFLTVRVGAAFWFL
ncbi:MAG: outer membrane beta-barrel protein [Candidatus Zixiibacteriota bacterium]|jgi:hypothetical protein